MPRATGQSRGTVLAFSARDGPKEVSFLIMLSRAVTLTVVGFLLAVTAACSQPQTSPAAAPSPTAGSQPKPLTLEQLTAIQPGLGTVMAQYANRFANAWFAAQDLNWDMTRYQIIEMVEIQEVGETTRPARAQALKAFEESFLNPLKDAANAKDLTAFASAYDRTIDGCNACHASQTSNDFPGGYKFIKIQRPTEPAFTNVDFRGQ